MDIFLEQTYWFANIYDNYRTINELEHRKGTIFRLMKKSYDCTKVYARYKQHYPAEFQSGEIAHLYSRIMDQYSLYYTEYVHICKHIRALSRENRKVIRGLSEEDRWAISPD
jgi:hypothetical protein